MNMPTIWSYLGSKDSLNRVPELNVLTSLGGWVVSNTVRPVSYHRDIQHFLDEKHFNGHCVQSVLPVGVLHEELPMELCDTLLQHTRATLPQHVSRASVKLISMGGNLPDCDKEHKTSLPLSVRKSRYFALMQAQWDPEQGELGREACKEWTRECFRILSKYGTGTMTYAPDEVHTYDDYITGQLLNKSSGAESELFLKLERVKAKYDHNNTFRQNLNINPGVKG